MSASDEAPSDGYLVARARDGYLDAYEILLTRYSGPAYLLALRLIGNREAARDVAQEALVSAWRGLPRFRGEAQFSTWLFRIVTRKALNQLARQPVNRTLDSVPEPSDTGAGPGDTYAQAEKTAAVQFAISELPASQRVPLILHQYHDLTYEQIASVTDSSVPAVRSQLFRARRALKSTLEEWR